MLWQYTQMFFLLGCLFSYMSFYRQIDKFGRVIFMYLSSVIWEVVALSILKIHFKWPGASNVVAYTYIPAGGEELAYIFNTMSMIFIVLTFVRSIDLVSKPIRGSEGYWLGE